ncbi:MAG: hypothetical protein A2135_03960 [Actinobacteria bacterium RBG_16_67_15]|nr:MAG: hypothetical protein A2135_03960 [Actinobacteria bacterium RBG_16_67_15]
MMAHELLHAVAAATKARRCLLVTAEVTGNPLLANVSVRSFQTLVSLQYEMPEGGSGLGFRPIARVAREARRLGQFDVAFVDPHHSYESSEAAFRLFGRSTQDHGWLIAHDCLPSYELSSPVLVRGAWCGSTYAAFRDVARRSDRAWFVVDDDFGLGVLGPRKTGHLVAHEVPAELADRWDRSDIDTKRELYREHGHLLMRAVSPGRADEVLGRLLRNEPVEL